MDDRLRTNRANWDARASVHAASEFYGTERFVEDPTLVTGVVRFDAARIGDVDGKRLLHLQCHIGTDSISWARLGAEVAGLDFSAGSIDIARDLAERAGTAVRFVVSDVHDAANALAGETFDVVYASIGVLCWIPKVADWVRVATSLLTPGGLLYVRDGHPVLFALDDERSDDLLALRYPYFETSEPLAFDAPVTYTGEEVAGANRTFEWNHGLAEVIQAFLDAGLYLERVEEYKTVEWKALPQMVELADGRFALPDGSRDLVPLEFSVLARRASDEG